MNILFDFIPFQHANGIGGHASFTKAILDELLKRRSTDTKLFATIDSSMPECKGYDIHGIISTNSITTIDLAKERIANSIAKYEIDVFFIAIAQLYAKYELTGISCKTVMFIHDIFDVERFNIKLDAIIYDNNKDSLWTQAKRIINLTCGRWEKQMRQCYDSIMPLYMADNTISYTVSEYTKAAITYYFPETKKEIRICYSPRKVVEGYDAPIENAVLKNLIAAGKTFLLMIAANRRYKNPRIVINVFKRLQQEYPDLYLLTLNYGKSTGSNHIDIPFLSDSDLQQAYQHAHALVFSSFFEGFGYPPIEAMRYGTPCIASNVTSIPEILGDAGIYFSPLYPADLYKAIKQVLADRNCRSEKMKRRYAEVTQRQDDDLRTLVDEIIGEKQ
jgi:glycosyltransferase involved in cell wall biosynthesis